MNLRTTLALIVEGALMSSALVGCSNKDGARGKAISREGFEDAPSNIEALLLATGADWLEEVSERGTPRVAGQECGKAKDATACKARVAELRKAGQWGLYWEGGTTYGYLGTKGDEVLRVGSKPELLTLLNGAIDSPAEAAAWAQANKYGRVQGAWWKKAGDAYEILCAIETSSCNPVVSEEHRLLMKPDGSFEVLEKVETYRNETKCYGRRPALFRSSQVRAASALGEHFARAAELEAASVHAFRVLRHELADHGAPANLIERAEVAAREEIEHARIMSRLARAFGATVAKPLVTRGPCRPLAELALENAVEGCVRETYGAVDAAVQAERARDPRIAAALRVIAPDELRHAELSWAVATWAEPRLSAAERRHIAAAMRAAVAELAHAAEHEVVECLHEQAGVPLPSSARATVRTLDEVLWSRAA